MPSNTPERSSYASVSQLTLNFGTPEPNVSNQVNKITSKQEYILDRQTERLLNRYRRREGGSKREREEVREREKERGGRREREEGREGGREEIYR